MDIQKTECLSLRGYQTVYLCTRCGHCCRWHGYVRVYPEEIKQISQFLGLEEEQFIQQFTELMPNRYGLCLTEHPDHSCIFFSSTDHNCLIYPVRPLQCRLFPNEWRISETLSELYPCQAYQLRYQLQSISHPSPYPAS